MRAAFFAVLLFSSTAFCGLTPFARIAKCFRKSLSADTSSFQVNEVKIAELKSRYEKMDVSEKKVSLQIEALRARGWPIDEVGSYNLYELRGLYLGGGNDRLLEKSFQNWMSALADPSLSLESKRELWTSVTAQLVDLNYGSSEGDVKVSLLQPKTNLKFKTVSESLLELGSGSEADLVRSAHEIYLRDAKNKAEKLGALAHIDFLRRFENQPGSTFPDEVFAGAQVALDFRERKVDLGSMSDGDRQTLNRFADFWVKEKEKYYQGDNAILRKLRYKEPHSSSKAVGTVDEFVRSEHFNLLGNGSRGWWHAITIDGAKSRSPIRQMYGEKATVPTDRKISWPAAGGKEFNPEYPQLDHFSVLVNRSLDKGTGLMVDRSIEIFFKVKGEWQPFFYKRVGNEWLPSNTFNGEEIPNACATCHMANGRFSPNPVVKIKTIADLNAVGYIHGIETNWSGSGNFAGALLQR